MPNSLREALLAAKLGESSLLADALLYCGLPAIKYFTVRKIILKLRKYHILLSPALVRRALNQGVFLSSIFQTHRRGRPEKIYALPTIESLIKKYAHGVATASDALVAKDMPNLRLYRQALHREFIRRAPGVYSRAFLGGRLGVCKRTTRHYDLREGIRSIRRLNEMNLRYISNWESVVNAASAGVNWLRIRYKSGKYYDARPNMNIAKRVMWKPYVEGVYLVTQKCNRYVYDPAPDWADRQYLYLSDDERSFAGSTDPNGFRSERLPYDPKSATFSIDRKAYQPESDKISASLPQYLAARRISVNPHLPRFRKQLNN
ncbi:MAG: hypothetical protein ABIO24_00155 [Saprospiraceae bacterium]